MSEYEQIIDEIVKHGVAITVNKIVDDNDIPHERKYVGSVVKLDFYEHDKVFEDKIDEQKNEISMLKSLIDNYRDAESKLFDENKELKQRIAELESKETESLDEVPDSITIDGYKCKIIKTESGLYISRDEIYSIIDKEKEPLKQKCKELEDKHQSDCIEINRLNTTIDVLIHKVEYLRQFAGLE